MVELNDLSVPVEVDQLRDGVPPWTQFISVKETQLEEFKNDPEAPQDKAHLLLYLNSRHWTENKEEKNVYVSGNGSGPKKKNPVFKRYNRIAFFADCMEEGRVCCKILETQAETLHFFNHMFRDGFGIGWMYVNEEPPPATEHLGDSLSVPMLGKASRIYPVRCTYEKVLPMIELKRPEAGETRYFAYHGLKNVAIGRSILAKSTCGGSFCDRQIPVENQGKGQAACGCFHRRDLYKMVSDHSVRIPCHANVSPSEFTIIENFRSLRFDDLLFQKGCKSIFSSPEIDVSDPFVTRVLRTHVKQLVEHVNGSGGWTVVGWVRTGKVRDANEEGNRDAIDIAAEDVSPHIIYLYPSDPDDTKPSEESTYTIMTESGIRKEMEAEKKTTDESRKRKTASSS